MLLLLMMKMMTMVFFNKNRRVRSWISVEWVFSISQGLLPHSIQTKPGPHTVSNLMDTWGRAAGP
jgi:hypothetical protein